MSSEEEEGGEAPEEPPPPITAEVTSDDEEEEEVVDVMETVREQCSESDACSQLNEVLEECNDRVNSKERTMETCTQELFDYLKCVNVCMEKLKFFEQLK